MAAVPDKITGILKVDLDSDETRIQKGAAVYVKGWTWDVNRNGTGEGYNAGAATPREGAILQSGELTLPTGENICIGTFESKDSNELYVFVWNANQSHLIYRVKGVDGAANIVYRGPILNFDAKPEHYIGEGRATFKLQKYFNKAIGSVDHWKFLMWTDHNNQPRFLSVEDSILTNSFNPTSYPYFAPFATDPDDVSKQLSKYITHAVETPMQCVVFEPQPRLPDEADKQNLMLYKGWQWRVKFIDVWNRESEHGVISDRFFTLIGSNCLASSTSLPRCVRLTLPAGSPLVNKIQIEYRTCATNSDLAIDGDWYLYDTISKYDDSANVRFWQRSVLSPYDVKMAEINAAPPGTYTSQQIAEMTARLTEYDSATNTFEYTFCGDKQCTLIPQEETQRTDNLVPRTTSAVMPLSEGVAMSNNLRGFQPLAPDMISKLSVTANPPSEECAGYDLRKITVYALIYTPADSGDAVIYGYTKYYNPPTTIQTGTLNCCGGSEPFKHRVTWGTPASATDPGQHVFTYGQDNFVMYLAGTPYLAIGKQVLIDPDNLNECPSGNFLYDGVTVEHSDCQPARENGSIAFQKFEFLVPPGEYIARLASHMCYTNQDYQSTSTFVSGKRIFSDLIDNVAFHKPSSFAKEMVIDVSSGNYDGKNPGNPFFMIQALKQGGGREIAYVREDVVDRVNIELAKLSLVGDGSTPGGTALERWSSLYTDHNGFYFVSGGLGVEAYVIIDRCSTPSTPGIPFYTPSMPGTLDSWGAFGCINSFLGECIEEFFLFGGADKMPAGDRRVITGKIQLCDSDIGLSGVTLVPYNMKPVRTNSKGEWKLIAHGRESLPSDLMNDTLILTQSGCAISVCDNPCDSSFPHINVSYITCAAPGARDTVAATVFAAIGGVNQSGPQNGGRYQFGPVFHDGHGRHGFVQTGDNLIVDMPSLIATKRFVHSLLNFNIDPGFLAPEWAEYMSFCCTRNLAWDDFFMWSADRIAFTDAAGYEGVSNPTKVRVYYESMIEYQKQNNLNSNAVWQFLVTGENQNQQILGDVIEFYTDGVGGWLSELVQYNIRYNEAGKFIELDYSEDLKNLKEGALFKVIRPKSCVNQEPFMELCPTIKIIDRIPTTLTGQLGYRDSYILSRTFPVPLYTVDPDDPTIITKSVSVRYSNYFYEHHSPSDNWGSHCATRGRIFFKNPYERQQYLETEVALSSPLISRSNFNGLSYFLDEARTRFDEQEFGSITVAFPELNTILFICKRDNFVVGYNDTSVRTDANGNVVAASLPNAFGTPQRKIGFEYGCQSIDVATIRKRNGVVVFVDRARAGLIFHNYSQAIDATLSGFRGWFTKKLARQNLNNQSAFAGIVRVFVSGMDPKTNEYYLTDTYLPGVQADGFSFPDAKFINTLNEPTTGQDETIVVDMLSASLKGFAPFTPEFYGTLEGFHADRNVLMFRKGNGWSLHGGNPATPLLNYFGTQTNKTIEIVSNLSAEKVKRFMYLEVYSSKHVLIATRVVTEQGQLSRILEGSWDKRDGFYTAAFLCDLNTPDDTNAPEATGANSLQDGNPLYGRWVKIRLEGKPSDSTVYTELSGIVPYVIPDGQSAD